MGTLMLSQCCIPGLCDLLALPEICLCPNCRFYMGLGLNSCFMQES